MSESGFQGQGGTAAGNRGRSGLAPTRTVAVTVLVAVSMAEVELERALVT
jgi:hypothetical protein